VTSWNGPISQAWFDSDGEAEPSLGWTAGEAARGHYAFGSTNPIQDEGEPWLRSPEQHPRSGYAGLEINCSQVGWGRSGTSDREMDPAELGEQEDAI
jgi:hypothetical protein